MHSVHPSRAKMLFEIFCALVMAASFAVAWIQTGASAFLAVAGAAALFSLVHASAVPGRRRVAKVDAGGARAASEEQGDLLAYMDRQPAEAAPAAETVAVADEPAAAEADEPCEAMEPDLPEAAEDSPAEAVDEEHSEQVGEPSEPSDFPAGDEAHHAPIQPLFEPEPLVRKQRAVFGRKAGRR